jgi:hypothetical protein
MVFFYSNAQEARLSKNIWLTLSSFPAENPAEWGVTITFGKCQSGDVWDSGSCSKTSK